MLDVEPADDRCDGAGLVGHDNGRSRNETERRTRAAQGGPAKGLERTAPGRRPFRGAAGTASFKTPRAIRPRLAGFPEAEPMLTHRIGLSTGLVWPVHALVAFSLDEEGGRHDAGRTSY